MDAAYYPAPVVEEVMRGELQQREHYGEILATWTQPSHTMSL